MMGHRTLLGSVNFRSLLFLISGKFGFIFFFSQLVPTDAVASWRAATAALARFIHNLWSFWV